MRSPRPLPHAPIRELVLVGGGHAHVQVLRRFVMAPPSGVRVTVVLDRPVAMYSGMVPGVVAGQYRAHEAEIDVWPLARRAGARIVDAAATGLDTDAGRVLVEGRPPIAYDAVSFDVGSTVAGLDLPGVREHAIPTRPIGRFVERVEAAMAAAGAKAAGAKAAATKAGAEAAGAVADPHASSTAAPRILVVGAGAGGVEVAFTLRHRTGGAVTLLDAGPTLLPGWTTGLGRRVRTAAELRGITMRSGRVVRVEANLAHLEAGDPLPFDLLVWVTGAAPHPWTRNLGLPMDAAGFVRVGPTLQVVDHPAIFGAGDCVSFDGSGSAGLPKAGVYAVRQGPFLTDNLLAYLGGGALRPYVPQRGFLTLLNLGDGVAIGARGPVSFEGAWVMRWKDRIDRRFMAMFQSVAADDTPTFEPMAGEMTCGGCAAKVGPGELGRALSRLDVPDDPTVELGLSHPDDAAVVRVPGGDRVGLTIDAFTAFCDDPWMVGRVAAVNAVNDLYAKGMTPRWALALVGIPDEGPRATEETLFQVMHGARTTLDALGITLVGGHTLRTDPLQVGFTVVGLADGPLRTQDQLAAGDALVLTRALGTGVLFYAHAAGRARGEWVRTAVAKMTRSHRDAAGVAGRFGARAATDVTGFGLAGHLAEMARASGVGATLSLAALPVLPGVMSLLAQGVRSTFHAQNTAARRHVRGAVDDPRAELLYDPQTAGGLLFAVPGDAAEAVVAALHAIGEVDAAVIGAVTTGTGVSIA
ncbi:MAG: selenide, water dikinase SelD [Pseudomonadota bacterium]|nr:selenide, water dikinase SelD [Pseudomonadota bacterium]